MCLTADCYRSAVKKSKSLPHVKLLPVAERGQESRHVALVREAHLVARRRVAPLGFQVQTDETRAQGDLLLFVHGQTPPLLHPHLQEACQPQVGSSATERLRKLLLIEAAEVVVARALVRAGSAPDFVQGLGVHARRRGRGAWRLVVGWSCWKRRRPQAAPRNTARQCCWSAPPAAYEASTSRRTVRSDASAEKLARLLVAAEAATAATSSHFDGVHFDDAVLSLCHVLAALVRERREEHAGDAERRGAARAAVQAMPLGDRLRVRPSINGRRDERKYCAGVSEKADLQAARTRGVASGDESATRLLAFPPCRAMVMQSHMVMGERSVGEMKI